MSRRGASILRTTQANGARLDSALPSLTSNAPTPSGQTSLVPQPLNSLRQTDACVHPPIARTSSIMNGHIHMSSQAPLINNTTISSQATKHAWTMQETNMINLPAPLSKQGDPTSRKRMPLSDITPKSNIGLPKGLMETASTTWNHGDVAVKSSGLDQFRDVVSGLNNYPRLGRLEEIPPNIRPNVQPRELSMTEMVAQAQRKDLPQEDDLPKASRSAHSSSQWPTFLKPLFPIGSENAKQTNDVVFPALPVEKKIPHIKKSVTQTIPEKTPQHATRKYDAFEIMWNDL